MTGIGILNYFEHHETVRLIESIRQHTGGHRVAICVWDNTDRDVRFQYASGADGPIPVTVLREGTNLGCAVARNRIWQHFRTTYPGMEYLVILDQDVTVGPRWLEDMLEVAEVHPDAGQVIWPVFNMAGDVPLSDGRVHNAASGASLYRMAAVQATGGWEERFFFYRFDTWFTLLSAKCGWRTYMITKYGKPGEDWTRWIQNHTRDGIVCCGPIRHHHPHRGVKRHPRSDRIKAESVALFQRLLDEHGLRAYYTHWPKVDFPSAVPLPAGHHVMVYHEFSPSMEEWSRYVWQYCSAVATPKVAVTLITNQMPSWGLEMPALQEKGHMRVLLREEADGPAADVIVTDTIGEMGRMAAAHKRGSPSVPMFVMSPGDMLACGDTPAVASSREIARMGDYFIAPSPVGAAGLVSWLRIKDDSKIFIVPSAVNERSLAIGSAKRFLYSRPYAVWCGDASPHSGGDRAISFVMTLRLPLDLIMVGRWSKFTMANARHRIVVKPATSDAERYGIMKGAKVVLALADPGGYSGVPGEAAALGVPCLAYDSPRMREMYAKWPGMHLVPAGERSRLLEELQRIVLTRAPALRPDLRGRTLAEMKSRVAQLPYHSGE